jgi:hypothetical protein
VRTLAVPANSLGSEVQWSQMVHIIRVADQAFLSAGVSADLIVRNFPRCLRPPRKHW